MARLRCPKELLTFSADDRSTIRAPLWCRRFIGRDDELAALQDARRLLGRGRGSFTIVDGEAGIGKSRLVKQFLRDAGSSARIVAIECVADAAEELQPIRSALAGLWAAQPPPDAPPLVLRTVAQLLPHDVEASVRASYAGATLGRAELFAGIAAAFARASAKRGTILVLEDLHWADETTLHFLAGLAPQLESMRLMLIATTRSELFERSDELADVTSRILRAHAVRHVPLRAFGRDEVAALIEGALTGRRPLPPATVSDIIRRCDGNPFFAEELLKVAVDRRPSERDALPVSIRASVRHRLAHFGDADRALLDVAAVLGVRFEHALLAELAERPHAEVLRALRTARSAGIVDDVDDASCRFHHALTRQAIYESLLTAETQALHRRVLRVLERRSDADRHVETLAYHAWEAHDDAASLRYGERAGDRSAELGLFSDARTYYQRVLAATRDAGDRARLYERVGDVDRAAGDFAGAIIALGTALDLRVQREEFDDAARLAVALAVERSNSGAEALPPLEEFIAQHGARLGTAARDAVDVFRARMWTAVGRFADAERLLGELARPADLEPRVRANFLTVLLNLSEHRGTVAAWRANAREMLALAPKLPPLLRAIQLTNVAQTGAWFAEGDLAAGALGEAQAIATHWGFESLLAFTRAVEAQLAFLAGDLAGAGRALDAVARRPDVAPAMIVASRIGPFLGVALADVSIARRWLQAAPGGAGDGDDRMYAAAATLAAGSLDGVVAPADVRAARAQLAALVGELGPGAFVPPPVAVAAAQSLDADQLVRLRSAAIAYGTAVDHGVARATSDLVIAIAASRSGAIELPRAVAAARQFHDAGWPLFEALALEYAGRGAEAFAIYERAGALDGMRRLAVDARAKRAPASAPCGLTAREWQVATLVAEGNSNVAIGRRLDVGIKTVEKHVSSVLLKLGARSRAQIATFVATQRGTRDSLVAQSEMGGGDGAFS